MNFRQSLTSSGNKVGACAPTKEERSKRKSIRNHDAVNQFLKLQVHQNSSKSEEEKPKTEDPSGS